MHRRRLLAGAIAATLAVAASSTLAQPATRLPRVIFIVNGNEVTARPFTRSFLEGLRQAGQVPGRTVQVDIRVAEVARVRKLIVDSAGESPAVLVVAGLSAARYARDATTTVPVVVATSSDLVDAGIVQSLAHPGGNITGSSDLTDEVTVKRLQLLKAALPNAARVVLLLNPEFPASAKIEARVRAAAPSLRLAVATVYASDTASLERAVDSLAKSPPDALFATDALAVLQSEALIRRATQLRIPVVHFWPGTAEQGALLSYQADIHDNFRRAADYVDRILKGAKPGDLPIYQSARYELVVNTKAASALGIVLPESFLNRADRKI